jgi:predicted  nucleic acid-binding Zn-ribbon protein
MRRSGTKAGQIPTEGTRLMTRVARHTPTIQELAARVSRLEKQMAEVVKMDGNTSPLHEMTEIRRALLDGRDELRRALADTATRELVIRLHNELQGELRARHAEVMTKFENLRTRPSQD